MPPKGFATTSVVYLLFPSLSSQLLVCRVPSTEISGPFLTYGSIYLSAVGPNATQLCQSVLSCWLPSLFLQLSFVAILKLATACPFLVCLISGSCHSLPINKTLFSVPLAILI